MKRLLNILIIIALAASYGVANAQYLGDITPNARSLSMGNADVAARGDGGAIFSNAASALFEYKSIQASVGFTKFTNDTYSKNRLIAVGGYGKINERHAILAGVRLMIEPRDVATEIRPLLQQYSLAYALKLGRYTALAATVRYSQNRTLPSVSPIKNDFKEFGLTLAAMARIPISKTSQTTCNLGVELASDFTSAMPYGLYPFRATAGIGFYIPVSDSHTVEINLEQMYAPWRANQQSYTNLATRLGVEYSLMRLLYFRVGAEAYDTTYTRNVDWCGALGLGVRFFHLQFDMAYTFSHDNSPLSNMLMFNLGLDF